MKILVAFDGTLNAREALRHGMDRVRREGGELIAMHVFNREAVLDYDATPWTSDKIEREMERYVAEAAAIIQNESNGVKTTMITCEGNPEREIVKVVKKQKVDVMLCPTSLKYICKKYEKALRERSEAEEALVHGEAATGAVRS